MEITPLERLRSMLTPSTSTSIRQRGDENGDNFVVRFSHNGYRYVVARIQEENCIDEMNNDEYQDSQDFESDDIEIRYDQSSYDDIVPCNCDKCNPQTDAKLGHLGKDLVKCIKTLEIPNWVLDMTLFEKFLYYICSFYTYNLYKMGINYLSKGFKLADLKERIPNLKSENKKMQEFIKSLPKFKEIKNAIEEIYSNSMKKAKERRNECFLELLLTPNENIDKLFCIKLILECYYLYYKSIGDTRCKELRKYVLPLLINFYKVANNIDANLVCDINNRFKNLTSISTSRQLKRIGFNIYENNQKIPSKPHRRYKEELSILKLVDKDGKGKAKDSAQF